MFGGLVSRILSAGVKPSVTEGVGAGSLDCAQEGQPEQLHPLCSRLAHEYDSTYASHVCPPHVAGQLPCTVGASGGEGVGAGSLGLPPKHTKSVVSSTIVLSVLLSFYLPLPIREIDPLIRSLDHYKYLQVTFLENIRTLVSRMAKVSRI